MPRVAGSRLEKTRAAVPASFGSTGKKVPSQDHSIGGFLVLWNLCIATIFIHCWHGGFDSAGRDSAFGWVILWGIF
jgi:hypothetical protein